MVPWHPGCVALGLKFNDASCRLRQPAGTNELAVPEERERGTWMPGTRCRDGVGGGATEGGMRHGGPETFFEEPPPRPITISIFHYTLLSDRPLPDVLFSAI